MTRGKGDAVSRFTYEGALIRNHRRMRRVMDETSVDGINGLQFAETLSKHLQFETRLLRRMKREKGLTQRVRPYTLQWLEKLGVFHV